MLVGTRFCRRSESQLKDGFGIFSLKIFTRHLLSEKSKIPTVSSQRFAYSLSASVSQ